MKKKKEIKEKSEKTKIDNLKLRVKESNADYEKLRISFNEKIEILDELKNLMWGKPVGSLYSGNQPHSYIEILAEVGKLKAERDTYGLTKSVLSEELGHLIRVVTKDPTLKEMKHKRDTEIFDPMQRY